MEQTFVAGTDVAVFALNSSNESFQRFTTVALTNAESHHLVNDFLHAFPKGESETGSCLHAAF